MSSPFAPKSLRRESHEENINRDSHFGSRYKPQPVSTNLLQQVTCPRSGQVTSAPTRTTLPSGMPPKTFSSRLLAEETNQGQGGTSNPSQGCKMCIPSRCVFCMRSRSYGNLSVFMQDQTQIDHKKAKGLKHRGLRLRQVRRAEMARKANLALGSLLRPKGADTSAAAILAGRPSQFSEKPFGRGNSKNSVLLACNTAARPASAGGAPEP